MTTSTDSSPSTAELKLVDSVQQSGKFQHQYLNYVVKEHDQLASIRSFSNNFVSSLAELQACGFPYAAMAAKLFGFRPALNHRALIKSFVEERASYQNYYQREKEKGVIEEKHLQGLNVAKVLIFVKQMCPDSDRMGQVVWSSLMRSLRSAALESMNMKKLEGLYTLDDIPFPTIGADSGS